MIRAKRINNRAARITGVALIAALAIPALFAPWVTGGDLGNVVGAPLAEATRELPLGLDNLGRDMAARLMWSARISLFVSLAATALAFSFGVAGGVIVAVLGGWVDKIGNRVVDLFMALPPLIFALVILSVAGTSVTILIVTAALMSATRFYRIARTLAANIVAQPYFEAAAARQESLYWLCVHEVLPNIVKPLLAQVGLQLCNAVLLVASLGFLGFGLPPPMTDLGTVVRENAPALGFGLWAPLFPAATIALFVTGINLLVDAASDVRSRSASN